MKTTHFIAALFLLTSLVLSGCDRTVTVSGTVVDTKGEALPGVGVIVSGSDAQAVSDGVGHYALGVAPGPIRLELVKTGYTPAAMELKQEGKDTLTADTATLWPLPVRKGVYLFENYRYRECSQAEPKRFMRIEKKDDQEIVLDSPPLFATKRAAETQTEATFYGTGKQGTSPMLIAYKLPAYDVELHRLEQRTAAIYVPRSNRGAKASDNDLPRDTVWAPVESIPISAVPIDEKERLLLDLRPAYPLVPGVYAIHWGAFAGYTSIDPRIFLFEVLDSTVSAPTVVAPETDEKKEEPPAKKEDTQDKTINQSPAVPDVSVTGGEF